MPSPIFSNEDREARKRESEGTEEQQRLAKQVAPEIVANVKESARHQFRTYGEVATAWGKDNFPRNTHSPYIPKSALEKAIRPVIREEFSLSDADFSVGVWLGDGDYIPGTYDDHYSNKISVRVDFHPPLT